MIGEAAPADGIRRLPAPSRREILDGLSRELAAAGIEGARQEAERLLALVFGISRSELLLALDIDVDPKEAGRIASASRRRLTGVPLQHIEGTVEFRELVLACDDRALVPRPETEQLVQEVVDWASGAAAEHGVRKVRRRAQRPPIESALDIGTGSGAIGLSLLREGIAERVVAVDISSRALEQAAENASRLGLADRIDLRWVRSSPWSALDSSQKFGLVVSNPPYVADGELDSLPAEVQHDPRVALSGGADGLDVVREIVRHAPARLRAGGGLFLEIGAGQAAEVRRLLHAAGGWSSVTVRRDLAGRERFVRALT